MQARHKTVMVKLTLDLIRRKSEHHDGVLGELFEISLHQLKIEKIETIDRICPKLRILYLQNNVISKIERMRRFKQLTYANFALNNITKIEGLGGCEKLEKLDFTVNFIDLDTFRHSMETLHHNTHLKEMYLTGYNSIVQQSSSSNNNICLIW